MSKKDYLFQQLKEHYFGVGNYQGKNNFFPIVLSLFPWHMIGARQMGHHRKNWSILFRNQSHLTVQSSEKGDTKLQIRLV